MKVITIVGARPQFIKAAAVSREFARHPGIREVIIHTGQHFDNNMSAVFFAEMQIPKPDYQLRINSLGHGAMTGRMLEQIEEILLHEQPDAVLVYGDTNSTLAGALAAKKLHRKVVHVEAGLRSFNLRMPEEINRILTDRISDILCCPTQQSVENLYREGFEAFPCTIARTGDIMQDAALYYSTLSSSRSTVIRDLQLEGKRFALCTVHRAENTDDISRLSSILAALNEIARSQPVVLPLHPRTAKIIASENIHLDFEPIEPVGYFDMIELLKNTDLVLTDSGGLQKEAFFFGKPCLTLRDETEWVELVEHGYNVLTGADRENILRHAAAIRTREMDFTRNLYGNGTAGAHIVDLIKSV